MLWPSSSARSNHGQVIRKPAAMAMGMQATSKARSTSRRQRIGVSVSIAILLQCLTSVPRHGVTDYVPALLLMPPQIELILVAERLDLQRDAPDVVLPMIDADGQQGSV